MDVVEQYVTLSKKSGANYFGLARFTVKIHLLQCFSGKQIFYCFGCHKGGDVIHFIREIERVPYRRAIEILAERVGVKLPEIEEPRQKEIYKKRERLTPPTPRLPVIFIMP